MEVGTHDDDAPCACDEDDNSVLFDLLRPLDRAVELLLIEPSLDFLGVMVCNERKKYLGESKFEVPERRRFDVD